MKGFRVKGLGFSLIKYFFLIFVYLFPIPYTLYPIYAANPCPSPGAGVPIPIGDCFGFGNITSLGDATSRLIVPIFSFASFLVILYFLLGAFKFLKSGGNKEEIAGARQMITQAIVGFMILIFAFFTLQFLMLKLFGITGLQLF